MRTAGRLISASCLALFASSLDAQVQPSAASANAAGPALPRQEDWFLSTGTWDGDPQLYVRELGEGPDTVVVLHGGWGAEHGELLQSMAPLTGSYRFVSYDQRGSLRSPAPDSSITFDRHIEDLELLRRELQLERMTLIGHSMGAVLASAYASRYPERIERLILVSPAYLKSPIPPGDKELQHQAYLASQAYRDRPAVRQELERHSLTRSAPPLSSREETARYRIGMAAGMLSDVSKWYLLTGGRAMFKRHVDELTSRTYPASGWDYIAEFGKRPYRVAIIAGDHDFVDFGNVLVRKWVAGMPNVELTIVENAGHIPWVDQPDAVTQALRHHLEKRAPR